MKKGVVNVKSMHDRMPGKILVGRKILKATGKSEAGKSGNEHGLETKGVNAVDGGRSEINAAVNG